MRKSPKVALLPGLANNQADKENKQMLVLKLVAVSHEQNTFRLDDCGTWLTLAAFKSNICYLYLLIQKKFCPIVGAIRHNGGR